MSRSRRAGLSRDEARQQPLYARMLGLQFLAPGGFLCFVFLEGAVALGLLLALAELVSWWGVLVLPMMVAAAVKLNDVVAGLLIRPTAGHAGVALRTGSSGVETVRLSPAVIAEVSAASRPGGGHPSARSATRRDETDALAGVRGQDHRRAATMDASALNGPPATRSWTEDRDHHQQRARQSAARRYEHRPQSGDE